MIPSRSQKIRERLHQYPFTIAFTILAFFYMIMAADKLSAAICFIAWNCLPSFAGETLISYLIDQDDRPRYKAAELIVGLIQVVLSLIGLWVFYRFLN